MQACWLSTLTSWEHRLDTSEDSYRSANTLLQLLQHFPADMSASTREHLLEHFKQLLAKLNRMRCATGTLTSCRSTSCSRPAHRQRQQGVWSLAR